MRHGASSGVEILLRSSEQRPLVQRQTVHQTLQLLLAQLDLVLQFTLLDDEGRLHLHKVAVVVQALRVQVGLHDAGNQPLATVQVLLQLLGILVLSHKQLPLLCQGSLRKEMSNYSLSKDIFLKITVSFSLILFCRWKTSLLL